MTMTVHVQIDGKRPFDGLVAVRRASHTDAADLPPDTRVQYDVELHTRLGGAMHLTGETSVEHRYGDGALVLAHLALDAVAMVPA